MDSVDSEDVLPQTSAASTQDDGDKVFFGAAYYHEYQPEPRLQEDLDLMQAAGFSVIRVGEATWAKWEPEDGVFDLDWMEDVLDGAHARGMSVILGTPTFAAPMWLARKYPEIAIERKNGTKTPWGSREEMDYTHPAFLFHAERVIREVIGRYADHPSVIGFQVHNEPGLHQIYSPAVIEDFKDRLRLRFGTVEALNKRWGLTFWSHDLSTWEDLWVPEGNGQPQYDMAWRSYQAAITNEYIEWQRDIVGEYRTDDQFITTCISLDRPAMHEQELAGVLDVAAANPYYFQQDALLTPQDRVGEQSWLTSGSWSVTMAADRVFGTRQEPFLVFETNAGPIGGPATNYPAYDGQLTQCAWSFISRGAEMIEYWHWHSLHYGTETYWGGVLPHDQRPGRIYREVSEIGHQIQLAGDAVVGLKPEHDVTFLYSVASKWALSFQPYKSESDDDPHKQRNERAYPELVEAFYKGAHDVGAQVRIVHDNQILGPDADVLMPAVQAAQEHSVLVVVGAYVFPDGMAAWLSEYVKAGGHLVVGPRTSIADLDACISTDPKPAGLAELAGAHYQEYANLRHPLPVSEVDGEEWISDGAAALDWVECLEAADAHVVARIDHPHYEKWAAITTRTVGSGRVTLVGVVPNDVLASDVMRWATQVESWESSNAVRRSSALNRDGNRVHVLFNWSWEPGEAIAPVPLADVLGSNSFEKGEKVTLGPWGTRVLLERL